MQTRPEFCPVQRLGPEVLLNAQEVNFGTQLQVELAVVRISLFTHENSEIQAYVHISCQCIVHILLILNLALVSTRHQVDNMKQVLTTMRMHVEQE